MVEVQAEVPGGVTIFVTVPLKRIADMVVGALEGGSHYWLNSFKLVTSGGADTPERPWYCNPSLFADPDFVAKAIYDKPTHDDPGHKLIGAKEFARGLQLMAARYHRHFADMVSEGDDAETADVFMQCVVLGEVVFG